MPDLFKHYCRSIGSARAAVQHISLTDSRYARQASVAATSVARHRRRNLIRASAAPFSTVEVRTARLRHETIPTDDAHASWPQARFATAVARCIYGTRPHMPYSPATSGLTARTGMPYHNRKGIFPLAEISPYGDASAISRVLSPFTGVSIIYLRPQSPAASSNLPLDIGRATLNCRYTWSCNPQGVQPDDIAASAVGSYPAFSPLPADGTGRGRRLFSVTLLHPHGRRAVNSCGALRCSDFPPSAEADSDRARLHFLSLSSLTGRSPVLMPYITSRLRYYICLQRHHLLYLHPRPRHRLRLSGLTISFPAPIRRIYPAQLPRGSYYTHPSRTCGIPVMQPPFGINGPRA